MNVSVQLSTAFGAVVGAYLLHRLVGPILAGRVVRARSAALASAEAAKDLNRVLTFWKRDATLQIPDSPGVQGLEAIRTAYSRYFGSVQAATGVSRSVVALRGGACVLETGTNHFVWRSPEGELRDVVDYLAVWERVRLNWYLAALSLTRVATASAPMGERQLGVAGAAQQADEAVKTR